MRRTMWIPWLGIAMCMSLLGVWGCGEDLQQSFDTAQFEEQQGNQTHAIELYQHIIQSDPESELAKKARERLVELKK